VAFVPNDHGNMLAGRDVVTGPEFRQVFVEVEPNAEVGELAGKVVVTATHDARTYSAAHCKVSNKKRWSVAAK